MESLEGVCVKSLRLLNVSHYHQRAGSHPQGVAIASGQCCIEVMTGGRGWVEFEGEWLELAAGDLLWHQAGDFTIGRSDFENPYRCLAVRFSLNDEAQTGLPRMSYWGELDEVKRFTREAVSLFVDDRFSNEELGYYLYSRLRFQVQLHQHRQRGHELPVQLRRVLQRIETDFAEPITMALLAEQAGWSEPHLHAVFKQHIKQTPHQLLIERRVRAAKERLSSSANPIKQIAVECGFSSAAAFCAIFKRSSGRTPARYRIEQQRWQVTPAH